MSISVLTWLSQLYNWVMNVLNIGKAKSEIAKNQAVTEKEKAETAAILRREKVKDAVILLRQKAGERLKIVNNATFSREELEKFIPDGSLLDEALFEVGAERKLWRDEAWEIRLTPKVNVARDRR